MRCMYMGLLAAMIFSASVIADDSKPSEKPSPFAPIPGYLFASGPGLGVAAGLTSGIGIAYRQHFSSKWGVNVVAGFMMTGTNWICADIGVNVTRTLSRERIARFYLVGGVSTFYEGAYDYSDASNNALWLNNFYFNMGAGIGMEFHFTKHIAFALEAPLSVTFATNEKEGFHFAHAWPIPSAYLTYYF